MTGQGNGEPRLSPRRVNARLKQLRAAEARAADKPWSEVAKIAGYSSEASAINAANKVLDRLPPIADADAWRLREAKRLEFEYQALLPRIAAEDAEAIRAASLIHTRLARMLGLDPLPSLNSLGMDTVQGAIDAIVGLAIAHLADDMRQAFLAQVETTLLQIEPPKGTP